MEIPPLISSTRVSLWKRSSMHGKKSLPYCSVRPKRPLRRVSFLARKIVDTGGLSASSTASRIHQWRRERSRGSQSIYWPYPGVGTKTRPLSTHVGRAARVGLMPSRPSFPGEYNRTGMSVGRPQAGGSFALCGCRCARKARPGWAADAAAGLRVFGPPLRHRRVPRPMIEADRSGAPLDRRRLENQGIR